MTAHELLGPYFERLEACSSTRWEGRVAQVVGQLVESDGPFCCVGELCHLIDSRGKSLPGRGGGFSGRDCAVNAA